jgi:hypothetical protein
VNNYISQVRDCRKNGQFKSFFISSMLLLTVAVEAQDSATLDEDVVNPADTSPPESWLDKSHSYTTGSTDALANWLDLFFGSPRADIEAASSSLRLITELDWSEGNSHSENVRLRGKVRLPRINKRLSLVFTDEDGDETVNADDIAGLNEEDKSSQLGFQYRFIDKLRSRVDFGLGLRSSGKVKASGRYRFQQGLSDNLTQRFTETLSFEDGEGFGSRSRYDLDYSLGDNRLLRWSNRAKFTERNDDVEWSTGWTLAKRLGNKEALSAFTWIEGETRPENFTSSYGVGLRYRRNIHRPWIFYEVSPSYSWAKDYWNDDRDGGALMTFRVELLFERFD